MTALPIEVASMPDAGWWEWMNFVVQVIVGGGTVGMAVMSWRLAAASNRRENAREAEEYRRREDIKVIVAAIVVPELTEVLGALNSIVGRLNEAKRSESREAFDEAMKGIAWLAPQLMLPTCDKVRERLDYLPDGRGRHIAHAMGVIGMLGKYTNTLSSMEHRELIDIFTRAVGYIHLLGTVANALRQAIGWDIDADELHNLRPCIEEAMAVEAAASAR